MHVDRSRSSIPEETVSPSLQIPRRTTALRIAVLYALVGMLWIVFSDWAMHRLVQDNATEAIIEGVKGWLFVLITASLLYAVLSRLFGEIRRSGQMLHDSEERWYYALDGAGHGVWDWSVQTGEVYFSVHWKAILGFEPEEIGGSLSEWESRVHPEDLPEVLAEMKRHLEGETPAYVTEHRLRAKDGSYRWILDQGRVMTRAPDGKPLRVVGTHTDITERKRLEAERRESEERYRGIFHESVTAIYMFDREKRFIESNQAGLDLLGYTREELLSRSIPDVDADPVVVLPAHRTLLSGGRLVAYEHRLRRKDGAIITVLNNSRPLTDAGGNVIGMLSTLMDITERKRAEEAIRKEESFRRSVIERAAEGLCVCRAVPEFPHVRFTVWNERMVQITGRTMDEINRKGWYQSVYPDAEYRQRAIRRMEEMREGKDLNAEEWNITRADGQGRTVAISTTLLPGDEGADHVLALMTDVTERRQTERALRASHEQLRALAGRLQTVREEERGHVAREIHDVLSQELTCIKMDLAWLGRRLPEPLGPDKVGLLLEKVEELKGEADVAIQTVQKIATELRPVVLDCLGLCAAVEWQVRNFQERTGIVCDSRVPAEEISVDRERSSAVFRILQESLTNIARHSSAARVEVGLECDDQALVLTVRDDGRGISQEKLQDMASLGLLGMRERAALLGGRCDIAGEPGKGTSIRVVIPLQAELVA
jgi:PAS domain S-box-containing protein